eukprot:gene9896-10909_t
MAAKDLEEEEVDEQILYDLFVHAEWQQDAELLNRGDQEFWRQRGPLYKKIWKVSRGMLFSMMEAARNSLWLKTNFACPPSEYVDKISNELPWNILLSKNGKFLAVLKNDHIEIRSSKDSFDSSIAKCQGKYILNFHLTKLNFQWQRIKNGLIAWRKLAWSKNSSFLACSTSVGDVNVFDLTGSLLYTIKQNNASLNLKTGLSDCFCSLFFMNSRQEKQSDEYLVTVSYQGILRKYHISSAGYKEQCSFSFTTFYPLGVGAVDFSQKHGVLIVAGFQEDEQSIEKEKPTAADVGISLWRELSGFPFYKMLESDSANFKTPTGKEILRKIVNIRLKARKYPENGILKMCLSPSEETLLTLHQNGSLSLWAMPSLKLQNTWSSSEQEYFNVPSSEFSFASSASKANDQASHKNVCGIKWWSDKAAICSKCSGAITVTSTKNFKNLLGHSPEIFEPWPRTTNANDGQFLVLECEKVYHSPGEKGQLKEKITTSDFFDKDEESETVMNRLSEVFKQTMFFLTEHEKFQPMAKKIKYLQRTYRLVSLKSTTPEELYSRKIDLEEYGEALDLAKRFKLDTDLVYQRQWSRKPMTVISIKDYLSKIKSRFWVLNECVQRVPDDLDTLKHLLQYGLLGTSLSVIQAVETTKELPFVVNEETDDDDLDSEAVVKNEARQSNLLKSMNIESLTTRQRHLCKYRWQILQYLDRLETYEIVLGGPFRAAERFKSDFFIQFRCCNIIDQAADYARSSSSEPLEEIFTYHGKDVLPHWIAILSNFPETTSVSSYKRLLPGLSDGSSEMNSWKELSHREADWVEDAEVIDHILDDLEEEDPAEFLYEEQPNLRKFRSCKDEKVLTQWYIQRAHEIEERSNLIDNSLSLVEFGIQKGVKGLDEICSNLKWLGVLAYEVGIDPAVSLVDFEKLSDIAKLKLLLSKSKVESFIGDFNSWGKPFLEQVGKSSLAKQWKLLHRYVIDAAKADLSFPLKIFENSIPGTSIPLIPDVAQLMKMAIESIYICKRDDQLDLAFRIVECLPTKEDDHLSGQIEDLHKRVDELEELLRGSEILEYYETPKTISFLVDSKGDYTIAKDIITSLARDVSKRQPPLKPEEWNNLLKHLSQLRNDVYNVISVSELYEIYVKHLLHSGIEDNLNLAKELLTCSHEKKKTADHHGTPTTEKQTKKPTKRLTNALHVMPHDDSVSLVLDAAREYFNAGANLMDSSMDLARKCLDIIEDRPASIQVELDLIGALGILDDFGVNMLPVQVRLYGDKVELVRIAVQSSSGTYKKTAKVRRLAKLLQVSGSDENERDGRISTVLAETAMLNEDYSFAKDMCFNLMDLRYAPAWTTCRELCEVEQFTDLQARQKLAAFSLTFCHPDEIESLLTARNLIETQIIYHELSKQLDSTSQSESESEDKEDLDSTDGQMQSSILGKTQNIISHVSDKNWWKSKVDWVSHIHRSSKKKKTKDNEDDDEDKMQNVLRFSCHPFYASLHQDVTSYSSSPQRGFRHFIRYEDYSSKFDVNQLLLRSQKLSESRAEGSITEPSSEVLIQLAQEELPEETLLCLAYILAMAKVDDIEEFFDKCCGDPLVMQTAVFVLSIDLLCQKSPGRSKDMACFYNTEPLSLVKHVLGLLETDEDDEIYKKYALLLGKYLSKLSDFMQAKTLEDLGKGVDVGRFMQDLEYKRETILGLAMTLEDDLLSTALSLAEKYEIEIWEVYCANIEFLFADSGLKAKEIQERLTNMDVVPSLLKHGTEFLSRMKLYVYPYIGGKDHAMLLMLFSLLQQCCGDDAKVEGSLDVASHIRLLKKIKAATSGMDYKALVHGNDPITAIKPVLMESNVHLLAKLVTKIPFKDVQTRISSSEIFLLYIQKAFWQEDKQQDDTEAKWLHKFEGSQKFFGKLSLKDMITFIDEVTFTENAVDLLAHETRLNIVKRALKYVRQQKAQPAKKGSKFEDKERMIFK